MRCDYCGDDFGDLARIEGKRICTACMIEEVYASRKWSEQLQAENERLRTIVFAIIAALEATDARVHSWGDCHICLADDREQHEDDCAYKLGLEYCKQTWSEIWKEDE